MNNKELQKFLSEDEIGSSRPDKQTVRDSLAVFVFVILNTSAESIRIGIGGEIADWN